MGREGISKGGGEVGVGGGGGGQWREGEREGREMGKGEESRG